MIGLILILVGLWVGRTGGEDYEHEKPLKLLPGDIIAYNGLLYIKKADNTFKQIFTETELRRGIH